jgi:dTDP-glucose 4,6-dehydratase
LPYFYFRGIIINVLITGGGGFVGHHLLEYLLVTTNWNFKVVESFRHGGISKRLSYLLNEYSSERHRVKVITHDLSTPIDNVTSKELGDINIIVNVASLCSVDESIANPVPFINNNISLQLNMLEYARTLNNLKTFIQISTDEVFGSADENEKHSEWQQFTPSNPYSASKASQESICHAYWKTYDLPIVITNTMNMFGERQSVRAFIPKTVEHILNNKLVPVYSEHINGSLVPCSRFYLYIKNQSDAIKFLIDYHINNPHRASDGLKMLPRFNITDGNELFNDEVVLKIANIMGVSRSPLFEYVEGVKFRPGHDSRYNLDGNKLISIGWTPPYSIDRSLEKTVKWFLDNPEWLTI